MLWIISILGLVVLSSLPQEAHLSEMCLFNPLCTCRQMHHEVTCRGVPFSTFPSLHAVENAYQVTVVRSGLQSLDEDVFLGTSVASLHLMHNNLQVIPPGAFRGLEELLTTLDLSNNFLQEFPISALHHLRQLRWLNLNSNEMGNFHSSTWSQMNSKSMIHSLFLGGNHITIIPDSAYVKLEYLHILDLDGNIIHDVGSRPFPISLSTLSLSNNLLKEVPLHAIYSLKNLRWLHLSGNLLKSLPTPFLLQTAGLEKLDCSNNVLKSIRRGVFNNSLVVREMNLGFNFLRTLPAQAFKGTKLERLFLDNNRLSSMHSDAMAGIESTLKVLDLSFNLLEKISIALSTLDTLLHLSLRGNLLKNMDQNDLYGCRNTLEVLDLSANKLLQVPKLMLKSFSRLVRISLQDNRIEKVYRDDFRGWGQSLRTLSLANNKMTFLSGGTFLHTPHLRELKLSFNNLMYLDQRIFIPIVKTLEVLELSAAFSEFNHPIELFIKDLERIEWLQIDHNNITLLSSTCFHSPNRLLHLDIEGNELNTLTDFFFDASALPRLSTVHLSNNQLNVIKTGTFDGLNHLSNIVIFNNKVRILETNAFANCRYLHTLVLSCNSITSIKPGAFQNLTRLTNLFLEHNALETFSLDSFMGVSGYLYLNLSSNQLSSLERFSGGNSTEYDVVDVRTLDLSDNQFSDIPFDFLEAISKSLVHLFLSQNSIGNVILPNFPRLQTLQLSNNKIDTLNQTLSTCCSLVQMLYLDHNKLTSVSKNIFNDMNNLRILDLSYNSIELLSENAFDGTRLERLNLSYNRFTQPPISSYISIRESLRYLDLSGNSISVLPESSFSAMMRLQALNLSSNQISVTHSDCFIGLQHLLELDLSHNFLQQNFTEDIFKPLRYLRSLHLRNSNVILIPPLILPQLRYLDASQNYLVNITHSTFHQTRRLRHLHLSNNSVQDVPNQLWKHISDLLSLDLSHNQITVLGVNSFAGLHFLRRLGIQGLPLKRLDPRALHGIRFLTSLSTDSYASVRSFRLQDLLSHSSAVRHVCMTIEESTLSHQIQGAFGTKLRELTITGENLKLILPDAFSGIYTHELTLRIEGTSVVNFPNGLLKYLPDIRYLTLDLRNNRLSALSPEVLAAITSEGSDIEQTQHITGGVLLEDNPWNCSCELLWLGRWLKRWLRETFQVHLLSVEAALYVNAVARKAICTVPDSNISHPLVDLKLSDVDCKKDTNGASAAIKLSIFVILMGQTANALSGFITGFIH